MVMQAHIEFPETANRKAVVIRKPNSVRIESGWKYLTDKAVIVLPRKVKYFDREKVRDVFRKGDPVIIQLGYDHKLQIEFTGYITHVAADIPIVIKCEDEMWKLKQLPVNISLRTTTLSHLLGQIVVGYSVDALDIDLGPIRFAKTTVAAVLEKLKENYSLYSYMDGKTLKVGKVYADNTGAAIPLHLERDVVHQNLNYKHKEDVRIRIEAVSTLSGGRTLKITVGDDDGELRQLSYYGIEVEAELVKLAELDLKKYKVDGFDGGVTTFGIPVVRHGDKVALRSNLYPDRNGTYYVEEIRVVFGESGYRRQLKLGEKAA